MPTKYLFECRFCSKRFKKGLRKNQIEVTCPKCREIDVDIIGVCKEVKK
jgi:phage FluMu protein Com